jgi:hypothetical protein
MTKMKIIIKKIIKKIEITINKIKSSNKLNSKKSTNEARISILFTVLGIIHNDAPASKQFLFQDPATEGAEGIIDLHGDIFFFLILISIFVL